MTAAVSIIARVAMTLTLHTVPVTIAAIPAALGELSTVANLQHNIVTSAIIIVHRHKPVTRLKEETLRAENRILKQGKLGFNLKFR